MVLLSYVSELVNVPYEKISQGAIPVNSGLYPWTWVRPEEKNFKSLQGG